MKTITIKTIKWLKPVIIPKEKHKISETTLVYFKALQKTALFLIMGVAINTVSAQVVYSKLGEKPGELNSSAVLELESTSRGFLLPRMKKKDRDIISVSDDAVGLQVWCTDCNTSTSPKSGQLCVYLGKDKGGWIPLTMNTTSVLTTNLPTKVSNSVTVNGTLVELVGAKPTKTGVVYREITDNDFAVLPVLDSLGNAVADHTYEKHTDTAVTTANSLITVPIPVPDLTSANPYYFRTYAKSPSGISYGNAVIFNLAPPKISASDVTFTNGNTLLPVFKGKLTVNAGTPQDAITEYGYYSGATDPPPTTADNKVVLSATGTGSLTLDLLNEKLNSETFTANPAVSLLVNDYNVKSLSKTYFRYYAIANGETVYSNVVSFTPVADPVTGGTAVAELGDIESISKPLKAGEESTSTITVNFTVTKAGTYNFIVATPVGGATTGLSIASKKGIFNIGGQILTFNIVGLPKTSLGGNTFAISKAVTLSTGAITQGVPTNGNAICDGTAPTEEVEITSPSGRKWMDRNLGASQAKTSTPADDYKAYGCLYQWGRGNDGHASFIWTANGSGTSVNPAIFGVIPPAGTKADELPTSDTPGSSFMAANITPWDWVSSSVPPKDYLWQGNNGNKNNPCPDGYHVPTKEEFQAEIDADATLSGLHFAGTPVRNQGGVSSNANLSSTKGSYVWSSTIGPDPRSSYYLVVIKPSDSPTPAPYIFSGIQRGDGIAVRCIKNL